MAICSRKESSEPQIEVKSVEEESIKIFSSLSDLSGRSSVYIGVGDMVED